MMIFVLYLLGHHAGERGVVLSQERNEFLFYLLRGLLITITVSIVIDEVRQAPSKKQYIADG